MTSDLIRTSSVCDPTPLCEYWLQDDARLNKKARLGVYIKLVGAAIIIIIGCFSQINNRILMFDKQDSYVFTDVWQVCWISYHQFEFIYINAWLLRRLDERICMCDVSILSLFFGSDLRDWSRWEPLKEKLQCWPGLWYPCPALKISFSGRPQSTLACQDFLRTAGQHALKGCRKHHIQKHQAIASRDGSKVPHQQCDAMYEEIICQNLELISKFLQNNCVIPTMFPRAMMSYTG